MQVNQFKNLVGDLLRRGVDDFAMTLGVIARIENEDFEIIAVQSNSGAYVAGEKYTLGDSFCRDVFEQGITIAETASDGAPLRRHHPLYRSLPLECYIGAPLTRNGKPWGCIDFSSMAQRDEPFGKADIDRIEALAAEISQLASKLE